MSVKSKGKQGCSLFVKTGLVLTLALGLTLPASFGDTGIANANESVTVAQYAGFSDVSRDYWAHDIIMEMKDKGIIYGYEDNTFRPAESISRIHVAVLLERALRLVPVRSGRTFTDVGPNHKHYDTVQTLYRAGVFDGKQDGSFGVNDKMTRAQMAKVLVKAFDLDLVDADKFSDVGSNHWASDYISTLRSNEITVGDNGKFNPGQPITRGHYAVFMKRSLDVTTDKNDAATPGYVGEPEPEIEEPEVTYFLDEYFSKIEWIERNGVVSLSLYPTALHINLSKENDYKNRETGHSGKAFDLVVAKYSSDARWSNTESLYSQYDCHVLFAGSSKVPWNIEPHRTVTDLAEMVLARCNP